MSLDVAKPSGERAPRGTRVAVVAAKFNGSIVEELLRGCLERLGQLGVTGKSVGVYRVPGAFELPSSAAMLAATGRWDAVIALGCVIRGQTPHFDYVAGEAAAGLRQVGVEYRLPVVFGVLTTNTRKQALDRAGGAHGHAGVSSADTAVEMVHLRRSLSVARSTGRAGARRRKS